LYRYGLVTVLATLTLALSGCGSTSRAVQADSVLLASPLAPPAALASDAPPPADSPLPAAATEPPATAASASEAAGDGLEPSPLEAAADDSAGPSGMPGAVVALQSSSQKAAEADEMLDEIYDPWESFNEKTFAFNRNVDRWVLKPVAKVYNKIMPEPFQIMVSNGFDNISFVPRAVNSLLQGKWGGTGRELGRFLINSTLGVGGLFDPAKDYWGIQKSREDFGQTLGVWGSGPGPYVIVPFLEPLTVRDGIGKFVDGFMDPLSYVLPFFWDRLGMKLGDILNERSLNLELFQGFEESVIDMYSAVRHGYLKRREQLIKE
jgi:phospholipid-binding lipoprotein MlaA